MPQSAGHSRGSDAELRAPGGCGPCARSRAGTRWSLLSSSEVDEEDDSPDAHVEFIRSVRSFQCTLLRQFRSAPAFSRRAALEVDAQGEFCSRGSGRPGWDEASGGEEPYLARFAQPFPARPIWAALPRPSLPGLPEEVPGGEAWPSDYSCAPLVCVVLQGALKMRAAVHSALSRLAEDPVGLVVNVNPEVPEALDTGRLLLFAVVGLRAPRRQRACASEQPRRTLLSPARRDAGGQASASSQAYEEEDILSVAEQRQMVWAAVHEALWDDGTLPEVVVDIFMLQDVWLYDRLFRWLALRQRTVAWKEPFRTLSQEELDLFVHQFGEETATHFLFVEQYTRHLRVAAAVSLGCLAASRLAHSGLLGEAPSLERWPWTLLAVFLPAWGFHFLASWRSVASRAGFRWLGSLGSVQNSVKEVARLQAVESDAEKRRRYLWVTLLTVPLMVVQLLVVLGVTVTFVVIEVYLYDVVWETLPVLWQLVACVIYNLAFGIAFMLILGLFHPVSNFVTKWEGHPDRDLSRWHLIAKIYANWFFAVFLYFFVIAFLYVPFGRDLAAFVEGLPHGFSAGSEARVAANSTARSGEAMHRTRDVVRHALSQFHPDANRLTTDVLLFFVLQDLTRLAQVLLPVLRALWGMGRFHGRSEGYAPQRHKRTAVISGLLAMLRVCLASRHRCEDEELSFPGRRSRVADGQSETSVESEDLDDDEYILYSARSNERLVDSTRKRSSMSSSHVSQARSRISTVSEGRSRISTISEARRSFAASEARPRLSLKGLPLRVPATPATRRRSTHVSQALPPLAAGQGCLVAYLLVERLRIDGTRVRRGAGATEEVAMLACGLEAVEAAPAATSRLRTCYASASRPGVLEEDPDEDLGDLFTLACEGALSKGPPGCGGTIRLSLLVEVLEPGVPLPSGSPQGGTNSWGSTVELSLEEDGHSGAVESEATGEALPCLGVGALAAKAGEAELGPVSVRYVAGLVRAPTHAEALELVPRALRRARQGLPLEDGELAPRPEEMAREEARALAGDPELPQARQPAGLPWVWWDEELAALYWEEVFELFSVKETFETFEIYTHLATSFSYVCLFGISAPICPLLALLFTSVEVRQDQLRLLWLSRPPHPDEETLRFKWRVSLGAWYEILRFTCHLSVVVNLLLWGLTYEGLGGKPASWDAGYWWRALALLLLVERAAVQLSKLLHQYFAQLDHETASAYLRRYQRLRRAFIAEDDEEESRNMGHRSSRQLRHEVCRRRLTRIPSKGLSSLV